MDYIIRGSNTQSDDPQSKMFPMHMHDTYEIYSLRRGDAVYYVEGTCYLIKPGDIVLMRKSESHQIVLQSNAVYGRWVVNFDLPFLKEIDKDQNLLALFDERPLGQYNHYPAAMFPENNWQYYLDKIIASEEKSFKLAYLMALLSELSECFLVLKSMEREGNSAPVNLIIRYINKNIKKDLSLGLLSEKFFLSKAHLNRIFKHSTGTTVWNYIVSKRLVLARELLLAGELPTEVFAQCGFKDYTTFYRAYKNQFGISPKNDCAR